MNMRLILVLLFIFCNLIRQDLYAQNADVYKSDAISREWNQNYLEAAEFYSKAASLYKEKGVIDTLCLFKAGQNYVKAGRFDKALPFFKQVFELGGYQKGKLWVYWAEAYVGLKEYDEAQAILDKGLELSPRDSISILKKKAILAFNENQGNDAVEFVNKALAIDSTNIELLKFKAQVLERVGKFAEAANVYRKLLDSVEDNKELILRLAIALYSDTESKYKSELDRYKKLPNPSRVDYTNSKKKLKQISQGYLEAIPLLELSLKNYPGQKAVIQRLYLSYKRLGNKEKELYYKKLLEQ